MLIQVLRSSYNNARVWDVHPLYCPLDFFPHDGINSLGTKFTNCNPNIIVHIQVNPLLPGSLIPQWDILFKIVSN